MTTALTCPKCAGSMRSYERNGVHVDQCADCRGLFLDRGELEQLVDAENRHYAPPASAPAPQRSSSSRDDYRNDDYKRKKKSSFLSELFD